MSLRVDDTTWASWETERLARAAAARAANTTAQRSRPPDRFVELSDLADELRADLADVTQQRDRLARIVDGLRAQVESTDECLRAILDEDSARARARRVGRTYVKPEPLSPEDAAWLQPEPMSLEDAAWLRDAA